MKKSILFLLVSLSLALSSLSQTDTLFKANGDTVISTTTKQTLSYSTVTSVLKPKVVVTPPVIDPPASGGGDIPAGYKLVFSKGYNSVSEINLNQKPEGIALSQFISTTIKRSGAGSFRSFTNGQNTSSGVRCEEQYTDAAANPTEFLLDFWITFPAYKQTGWGGSIGFQYHPNNDGSANLFLYGTEGVFTFARYLDTHNPSGTKGSSFYQTDYPNGKKSIQSGVFYHVRVFGKWSTGSDGYFTAYVDDMVKPYYKFSGRTQDNSGKPYLKIGQNNWVGSVGVEEEIDDLNIYAK